MAAHPASMGPAMDAPWEFAPPHGPAMWLGMGRDGPWMGPGPHRMDLRPLDARQAAASPPWVMVRVRALGPSPLP